MKIPKFKSPEFDMLETAAVVSALRSYYEGLLEIHKSSPAPDVKLEGEILSTKSALAKVSRSLKKVSRDLPL